MLKIIAAMEAGAKKEELGYIEISGISGAEGTVAESYREMLDTVEDIEAKQKGYQVIKPQVVKQAHEQEERKVVEVPRAAEKPVEKPVDVEKARAAEKLAKRERAEKEEVKAVASSMPVAKPRFGALKIKAVSDKGLVLPGLQISDQIHELERIVAALKENAFDQEQIKITRMETEGLEREVLELKKELRREGKKLSPLEQSLWDMRDLRLDEVSALLSGYKKRG
jgi:hypothetical protein